MIEDLMHQRDRLLSIVRDSLGKKTPPHRAKLGQQVDQIITAKFAKVNFDHGIGERLGVTSGTFRETYKQAKGAQHGDRIRKPRSI